MPPTNQQLPTVPKEDLVRVIMALIGSGNEDKAREFDMANRVGYFDGSLKKIQEEQKRALMSKETESWLAKFITQSPEMLSMKEEVRTLAPLADASVIIHGETGTGKELLARALHGDRNKDTFVELNCAGLPEHLVESELFGHVKGAFTGATDSKPGMFHKANKGTLFLDEVGELPINIQAKFLRALQEKRIRRVGAFTVETIECRVVAATHQNLLKQIKDGLFREDLYHRLNEFIITTIPLCSRMDDIPLIVSSLDLAKKFPVGQIDWAKLCRNGALTGNVRSLQHIVRRYLVLGKLPT